MERLRRLYMWVQGSEGGENKKEILTTTGSLWELELLYVFLALHKTERVRFQTFLWIYKYSQSRQNPLWSFSNPGQSPPLHSRVIKEMAKQNPLWNTKKTFLGCWSLRINKSKELSLPQLKECSPLFKEGWLPKGHCRGLGTPAY